MANWNFVSAYDDDSVAWLREQGYFHPAVRPGNVMPTTAEMKWALEAEETLIFDYPRSDGQLRATREGGSGGTCLVLEGFDWEDARSIPGDYFTVRGSDVVLSVLIRLCARCGQLYFYPDTGDPAIVLDASLDAEAVAELHAEACEMADGWAYFFEQMYGPEGLARS
jgi:hypothetical protein